MSDDDNTRKQLEEDATEDLELKDENADKVTGGSGGEENPKETLSINYGNIKYEY
jgi:hypothetical protein